MVLRGPLDLALAVGWLFATACGRFGFEGGSDAAGPSDAGSDAGSDPVFDARPDAAADAAIDAAPSPIAYAGPIVQRATGAGATDTFAVQAHAAGNAVVMQVSCAGNNVPTAVVVTAQGWTFTQLGPITASMSSTQRSATVVAIAPDTVRATVTVKWAGSNCNGSKNELGDEFTMTDPAGGKLTFDAFNATEGVGPCQGTVKTTHDHVAVWAACNSDDSVTAVGAGYLLGADDGVGDWSEYAITNHPAGTVEKVDFANPDVGYVLSMVTIKPR